MNKRGKVISLTVIISLVIVTILAIGGVKVANANKINSSLELGIKYLTEGNYEEARLEFSKAISIDDKHEKATELLGLTENYIELNNLYANKEYNLAAELIAKIKGNKYLGYIESSINEISDKHEEKIVIINEINNLDSQIQQLISGNKFQEAIDLINKYLGEDLKQEYLDKLNELMNGVNESKATYEEEQARIAEEERKRQEEANREITEDEAKMILQTKHPNFGNGSASGITNKNGNKYWVFLHLYVADRETQRVGSEVYLVGVTTKEVIRIQEYEEVNRYFSEFQ